MHSLAELMRGIGGDGVSLAMERADRPFLFYFVPFLFSWSVTIAHLSKVSCGDSAFYTVCAVRLKAFFLVQQTSQG